MSIDDLYIFPMIFKRENIYYHNTYLKYVTYNFVKAIQMANAGWYGVRYENWHIITSYCQAVTVILT